MPRLLHRGVWIAVLRGTGASREVRTAQRDAPPAQLIRIGYLPDVENR